VIEHIVQNCKTLAYVIRAQGEVQNTLFPTPPDLELQVGFVVYPAGGIVRPHRHVSITRTIQRTCEVIAVRQGRCDVELYDDDKELVATRELRPGDVLIVVTGGHGFRMHEDTVLLEVKQGPYYGLSEKELLK
jgi:cupin fold WbuC family metalloprotein